MQHARCWEANKPVLGHCQGYGFAFSYPHSHALSHFSRNPPPPPPPLFFFFFFSRVCAVNGIDVEFIDVCQHYLGKKAYVVAMIFSVLTLVGACMVYWVCRFVCNQEAKALCLQCVCMRSV